MSAWNDIVLRVIATDNRPRKAAEELVATWLREEDPEPVHKSWGSDLAKDVAAERERLGLEPAPTLASYHRERLGGSS